MEPNTWMARVKLFAGAREIQGADEATFSIGGESLCAEDFLRLFFKNHPRLSALGGRLAVNLEFADDRTPIHSGDDLALIPPVSGG